MICFGRWPLDVQEGIYDMLLLYIDLLNAHLQKSILPVDLLQILAVVCASKLTKFQPWYTYILIHIMYFILSHPSLFGITKTIFEFRPLTPRQIGISKIVVELGCRYIGSHGWAVVRKCSRVLIPPCLFIITISMVGWLRLLIPSVKRWVIFQAKSIFFKHI